MIKSGTKLTTDKIVIILIKLLKILKYIHKLNPPVIHRDINPENIIINKSKEIYLIDFDSTACLVKDNLSSEEIFEGTIGYSPDKLYHGKALPQTDIYSLGMTIIFLLTGKNPNEIEFLNNKPNYKNYVHIPPHRSVIIDKMIEPDFSQRIKCTDNVLKALSKNYKVEDKEKPVHKINIDAKEKNEHGVTTLMTEVMNNNYEMSKLLIENGADVNAPDKKGKTPLIWAADYSDAHMTKLLIDAGGSKLTAL